MQDMALTVTPISASCGAILSGVDLSAPLSNSVLSGIHQAFLDHYVLVFYDQKLSHDDQIRFARHFGDLEIHPIVNGMENHPEIIKVMKPAGEPATFGTDWHSDNTFFEEPSLGTVLRSETIPPVGGDTLYANQYLAYETLSEGLKTMLDGMMAIHSASVAYTAPSTEAKYKGESAITYRWSENVHDEVEHPVVRTHPETGRKSLFVNEMFTTRFKDMTVEESQPLLNYLYTHASKPDFTCRIVWRRDTVTLWDNRCLQHYAMDDYQDHERLMYRVTISGDKPH